MLRVSYCEPRALVTHHAVDPPALLVLDLVAETQARTAYFEPRSVRRVHELDGVLHVLSA